MCSYAGSPATVVGPLRTVVKLMCAKCCVTHSASLSHDCGDIPDGMPRTTTSRLSGSPRPGAGAVAASVTFPFGAATDQVAGTFSVNWFPASCTVRPTAVAANAADPTSATPTMKPTSDVVPALLSVYDLDIIGITQEDVTQIPARANQARRRGAGVRPGSSPTPSGSKMRTTIL